MGKWHNVLYCCHCVAFALAFAAGIFLAHQGNFLSAILAVIEEMRGDYLVGPKDRDLMNTDPVVRSEAAVRDMRSCFVIVAALALTIAVTVLINIYCMTALMVGPFAGAIRAGPGWVAIISEMQRELADMAAGDEGAGGGGGGGGYDDEDFGGGGSDMGSPAGSEGGSSDAGSPEESEVDTDAPEESDAGSDAGSEGGSDTGSD